jgi:uncharacterized protein YecE (DUF72 family)
MLMVGTAGYSYQDWKGVFYPPTMKDSDFLHFYSERFACVEIDSTYYAVPSPSMFESISKKVPEGFKFTVKVPSTFTHQREKFEETAAEFRRSIEPIVEKGMLGCLVAQFPYSFKGSGEGLEHIERINVSMGQPLVVEFRHRSWQNRNVYSFLEDKGIGYVNVDLPRIAGLPVPSETVTSADVAYVRLHGRVDAKTWWEPEEAKQRYAYLYNEDELREWVPRIRHMESMSRHLYVVFNNHFRGFATRNAETMGEVLGLKRKRQVQELSG